MKISYAWLKELTAVNWSPERFTEDLTMVGLEVESHQDLAQAFDGFVVGVVREREKHPNADRLSVCKVDVGRGDTLQIVCGAPNVAEGQKVAVGLVGATVPHNQHDPEGKPFVLTRAKVRGVESHGMICSSSELGLGKDAEGILVLDRSARVGQSLAKHLRRTDVVFDVGITPNRPDCLSHVGVAREVAMLAGTRIKVPSAKVCEVSPPASTLAKVIVRDSDLCPRYSGRVITGVTVGPSPQWLQDRLSVVGVRPINVIVDVTNYVMLELGHPLHAFDLDTLNDRKIVVRRAGTDAEFTTLDGKVRRLDKDMLMICDGRGPVALAGIMGGANSEISGSTTRILLESAYFLPSSVRRTARALGMSTEASYRFERGMDPEGTVNALNRAAGLIAELTGARVQGGVIDVYPKKLRPPAIPVRVLHTNKVLGTDLGAADMARFLRKIGAQVKKRTQKRLTVVPPTYRVDLTSEIDMIEEVARVFGYNNIETRTKAGIDFSTTQGKDSVVNELRASLTGAGFQEILSISLQQEQLGALEGKPAIRVLNPVSTEMQVLRTGMIPGALEAVRFNHRHGNTDLRLFEIGTVFNLKAAGDIESLDGYIEEVRLVLAFTGKRLPVAFDRKPQEGDLFDVKGEIEALLRGLCLDKYRFISYDARNTLTEPTVAVEINGTYAGRFGKVKKEVTDKFDIEGAVYVCELSAGVLESAWVRERKYRALPRFPSVKRDLAFTVDRFIRQEDVASAVRTSAGPLLESLMLFDMYEGSQAGSGRKSLAYALTFRAEDHTLTDQEVDALIRNVVDHTRSACNAELRA